MVLLSEQLVDFIVQVSDFVVCQIACWDKGRSNLVKLMGHTLGSLTLPKEHAGRQ